MENIKGLDQNDINNFNNLLLKIHNDFDNINIYANSDEDSDNEDHIISDLLDNFIKNNYSKDSFEFIMTILNNDNLSEFMYHLLTKITDINVIDNIISQLTKLFNLKIMSINIFKNVNNLNIGTITNLKYFDILIKNYDEGYKFLKKDVLDIIIKYIDTQYIDKSFVDACFENNGFYILYLINNNYCKDSIVIDIINKIDNINTIKILLDNIPNFIIDKYILKNLILKFLDNQHIILYFRQYAITHNIQINYREINQIIKSNNILNNLIESIKNNQMDIITELIIKIDNQVILNDEYYELIKELALNDRYDLIKIIFELFLSNTNDNKLHKYNELIEDIKYDFIENGKINDLDKILNIIKY